MNFIIFIDNYSNWYIVVLWFNYSNCINSYFFIGSFSRDSISRDSISLSSLFTPDVSLSSNWCDLPFWFGVKSFNILLASVFVSRLLGLCLTCLSSFFRYHNSISRSYMVVSDLCFLNLFSTFFILKGSTIYLLSTCWSRIISFKAIKHFHLRVGSFKLSIMSNKASFSLLLVMTFLEWLS